VILLSAAAPGPAAAVGGCVVMRGLFLSGR
jgi:hypothetical protein